MTIGQATIKRPIQVKRPRSKDTTSLKLPSDEQFNRWLREQVAQAAPAGDNDNYRIALVKEIQTIVWDASLSYGIPIDYLNGFVFLTGDCYAVAGDRAGPCLLREGVALHYGLRTNGRLAKRLLNKRTQLLKARPTNTTQRQIARIENQIQAIDERFNPAKAIPAASACLSYLRSKYGDWGMAFMVYRGNQKEIVNAAWCVTHSGFLTWGQQGSTLAAINDKNINWSLIVHLAESGKHPKTDYVIAGMPRQERQFWFRLLAAAQVTSKQPIRFLADSR